MTLEQVIGEGGAGVVVKAKDKIMNADIALKVALPSGFSFGPEEERRLNREAAVMKRVDHRCIVKLHESFFNENKQGGFVLANAPLSPPSSQLRCAFAFDAGGMVGHGGCVAVCLCMLRSSSVV